MIILKLYFCYILHTHKVITCITIDWCKKNIIVPSIIDNVYNIKFVIRTFHSNIKAQHKIYFAELKLAILRMGQIENNWYANILIVAVWSATLVGKHHYIVIVNRIIEVYILAKINNFKRWVLVILHSIM